MGREYIRRRRGRGAGRKRKGRKRAVSLPSLPVPSAVVSPLASVSRPPHDLLLNLRGWWAMKSQVLHTVWCDIFGEAVGLKLITLGSERVRRTGSGYALIYDTSFRVYKTFSPAVCVPFSIRRSTRSSALTLHSAIKSSESRGCKTTPPT